MGECRGGEGGGGGDCSIKLFGKTIPVPEVGDVAKVGFPHLIWFLGAVLGVS